MKVEKITGAPAAELGNAISDAIHAALEKGMETDVACSIAVKVISDYAADAYGKEYLPDLAKLLIGNVRADTPGK